MACPKNPVNPKHSLTRHLNRSDMKSGQKQCTKYFYYSDQQESNQNKSHSSTKLVTSSNLNNSQLETTEPIAYKKSISKRQKINRGKGFTLTEVLITIVIVGILSAIALPNFLNQILKTRQNEAAALITQLQNAIISYADENGTYPTSWKDLNEIVSIMTPSGATTQEDFEKMTLASSSCKNADGNNCYTVKAINENNDSLFILSTEPINEKHKNYNVIACLDLISGDSDFKKGTLSAPAQISDLMCREQ